MELKNNQETHSIGFIENCLISITNIYKRVPKWIILVFSICLIGYILNREIDIEHHHKDSALAAINFFSELRKSSNEAESSKDFDPKTLNEINEIDSGLIVSFIAVGGDSIAQVYNQLTEKQKDILKWAYQRANKYLAQELSLKS